jgi:hypothetical protein
MKIYLASNYSTHPEMRERAAELQALGHEVTSEWISGSHGGDDRAAYAQIDLRDLDASDAVIFWSTTPPNSRTRGGKHVEFGYALAKGKAIFIVGKAENVFHHLPQVIQRVEFADVLALIGSALPPVAAEQKLCPKCGSDRMCPHGCFCCASSKEVTSTVNSESPDSEKEKGGAK